MSRSSDAPSGPVPRASLRREIAAILGFKLLALIALYYLFFDERPQITPVCVEQRVLDGPAPSGASDD